MVFSAHLSMLFRELPYLERPAAAAAAGFGVVETWWPGDDVVVEWLDEARAHSLAVRLLNCDCGDIGAGERGFLNVPERREQTLAAFTAAAGVPFVHLLVGLDTGEAPRDDQLAVAAGVLAECAEIARRAGVRIVIEPINDRDIPGYLVTTPAAAQALIEAARAGDVLLLYDAYHAARMGTDPIEEVASWLPQIGHVHYADCPGRGAPGTGTIDLARFVAVLEGGGYEGAVGLELDPGPSTPAALAEVLSWS